MKLQGDKSGRKGHLSVATEVLSHSFNVVALFCGTQLVTNCIRLRIAIPFFSSVTLFI